MIDRLSQGRDNLYCIRLPEEAANEKSYLHSQIKAHDSELCKLNRNAAKESEPGKLEIYLAHLYEDYEAIGGKPVWYTAPRYKCDVGQILEGGPEFLRELV